MSQIDLMTRRRFAPLFVTQFLGAFNDNLFKNALVVAITFGAAQSAQEASTLVNLSAGVFILPFFLFSATAGQLADKLDKAGLVRFTKLAEIAIMGLAALGFALSSLPLLMAVLFLMGTQSALFGPVKYSILPQHLREEELVGGNGMIEMGTFVAIVLGTLAGTQLPGGYVSVAALAVAVAGYAASRFVPAAPGQRDLRVNWNIATATADNVGYARKERAVWLSILGISWFWFYGALLLAQFPNIAKELLAGDQGVVGLLLALFSIGIGAGSLLCERLSGEQVELGLVPFGSIGLTLFGVDLFFALSAVHVTPGTTVGALAFLQDARNLRVVLDLVMLGMFGGFYIVPLYAMMQQRSEAAIRSRIIAANNILNAAFMVAAALVAIGLRAAGVGLAGLVLITALLNALVAAYIYTLLPEFLVRFIIWLLVHTMYRVRADGLEHLPKEGPAVIVCNHVSFVDAPILAAMSRRPIRFVMDHRIFKTPVLSFIFRTGKAIPIAPRHENEALMEQALDKVAEALADGDLVCIFPEGKLTKDGQMNPFKAGVDRILERTPVPVVPMALRGLWGSFFSRKDGGAMAKRPTRFYSKVDVVCEAPMPPEAADAAALQAVVERMVGDGQARLA